MAFNQGVSSVPLILSSSNVLVYSNSSSGNALSVQQLGAGNVATFQTSTGASALFINPNGRVGLGTTNPATTLDVFTGTMNAATVAGTTLYGVVAGSNTVSGTTLTASTAMNTSGTGVYQVAGTTVIDASRNLTNIGTVGSGAITSTSTVSGTTLTASTAHNTSGTGVYQVAGTTVIDASRNLTNIGTISGTTITASSSFSGPGTNLTGTASSLNVGGSAGSLSTTYTAGRILYGAGSGVPTTTSTLFYDSANGRVGIGTTNPLRTFHTVGEIMHSGTTTSSFFNVCDSAGNNGGSQTLYLRGLITGGTAATAMASFYVQTAGATFSYLGTGTVYSSGGTLTNTNPSDLNLKSNITQISNTLETVTRLNPVEYVWKDQEKFGPGVQYGLVAQEVQTVLPELVKTTIDGNLGYDPVSLIPFLIGAIQELSAENTALKTRLDILEARLAALEGTVGSRVGA